MWCDIDRICNQFIFYCQNQVRTYNSDAIGTSTNDQNIALSCWNSTVNNSFLISAVLLEGGGIKAERGTGGRKRIRGRKRRKGREKEVGRMEGGREGGERRIFMQNSVEDSMRKTDIYLIWPKM